MSYDWKALAPTRPLAVADIAATSALYVPRFGAGADEIDALLDAGLDQPVAIFGPAGAGKSTELGALAKRRQPKWVGPLVRLDKLLAYTETTTVDDVLEAIARFTIEVAIDRLGLKLSGDLAAAVGRVSLGVGAHMFPRGFDLLLATVRDLQRASRQHDIGLLIDGLEKAAPDLARRVLQRLESLRAEARLVAVVPTSLAAGPGASALDNYHHVAIGAVVVSDSVEVLMKGPTDGDRFLFEIGARRLGVPSDRLGRESWDTTPRALRRCIVMSGGLVRTVLQLLQRAALYATMAGRATPDVEDVQRAEDEQRSFLLRLLSEGDSEALRAAHNTNGLEVPLEKRIRFLANGLLLEHQVGGERFVHVSPLLRHPILGAPE